MQTFDYLLNVGGNYTAVINGMTDATGEFRASVETAQNWLGKLSTHLAVFDLFRNAVESVSGALQEMSQSGVALDSQMHDLSAIAGVTGKVLDEIEGYARDSAKAFGTDAATAVEVQIAAVATVFGAGQIPRGVAGDGQCDTDHVQTDGE